MKRLTACCCFFLALSSLRLPCSAQSPQVQVQLLKNSGEEDREFLITSSADLQQIAAFLSGITPVADPNWPSLGWRGFLLMNQGAASLPQEIRVFEGVIRIFNGSVYRFYNDVNDIEDWLYDRAAPVFLLPFSMPRAARLSAASNPRPMDAIAIPIAPSAQALPASGSEPPYEPDKWNTADANQYKNNCYNYACNTKTGVANGRVARPGRASGTDPPLPGEANYNCAKFIAAAKGDGLAQADCDKACPKGSYKVMLAMDTAGGQGLAPDFHWYRQDDSGNFSHKPGGGEATNKDSSGNAITDPRTSDNRRRAPNGVWIAGYKVCDEGCFCVDPAKIMIK